MCSERERGLSCGYDMMPLDWCTENTRAKVGVDKR